MSYGFIRDTTGNLIAATSDISVIMCVINKSLQPLPAACRLVAAVSVNPAQPLAKRHVT
jgi:hypothetical protein